ncbi:hypothetical protein HYW87_02315 [Candidatus Roizmanbacteria bacterium]|nr:hypothetical protein [Candidatus Roizmanbacteria bacterium]
MRIFFLLITLFQIFVTLTHAQDMESSLYRIEESSLSVSSNESRGGKNRIEIVEKKDLPAFSSLGFALKKTNQKQNDFIFTLSDSSVLWDELKTHTLSKGTTVMEIAMKGPKRYRIYASEEKKLTSFVGETFPDTQCDPPVRCNEKRAQVWKNTSEYGFGYSLDNQYFRPFADVSAGEDPVIMLENAAGKTTLTFQIVASEIQSKQAYQTTVHLLAVPGF